MTFAIFALAVALPHQNAPHTLDGWGEHADLAPEVVLPTEELDRVKRQSIFIPRVVKTCAAVMGAWTVQNWVGRFTRVDQIVAGHADETRQKVDEYLQKLKTDYHIEEEAHAYIPNDFNMEMPMLGMIWAPQTCERPSTKGQ